jgi:hypothetical protein
VPVEFIFIQLASLYMNIIWVKRYLWIVAILLRLCGSIESIYIHAICIIYSFNAPTISFYICTKYTYNIMWYIIIHSFVYYTHTLTHSLELSSLEANIRGWFSLFFYFLPCDLASLCNALPENFMDIYEKCYEDNYCKTRNFFHESHHLRLLFVLTLSQLFIMS